MSKIIKLRKVPENNRPTRYSSENNYKVEILCRYFMVRFFFQKKVQNLYFKTKKNG
jgi:hypothetical protein|uniref:Uncharacterized protein n=1 Tax=viral metagenome TaxID=1070528 RepID=A0A6C0AKJ3_9ZZZZ